LIEVNLGGDLIKQRVAQPGAGKRGGYRTVIAYRKGARAFFLWASPSQHGRTSTMTSWQP
jgi:hypothetical protein